jgi:tetratricopeptide (TPR) repeat protein
MPSPQETMLQEALAAIESGNRTRARDLLTRLLKTGQENTEYWIWMSAVVETQKERAYCLNQVLKLDPQNAAAKRGLAMMGIGPVDDSQVLPARYQRRNWQSKLFASDETERKAPPIQQVALLGLALVVVVGVLIVAAFGEFMSRTTPTSVAVRRATLTTTVTTEPTIFITQTGTIGPTPLAMLLQVTYTPTPLYVNTPHPAVEAYRVAIRAYNRGDWEVTRRYMNDLLVAEPGSVDAIYYIGESYRMEGKFADAIKSFTKALDLNPNFAPAYLGRARTALDANPKDFRTAQADLEKAIAKDGNYGEAYLELALLHIKNQKPKDAIDLLVPLIQIMPSSPDLYLYLGQAYLANGNTSQALTNAEKVRELDATHLAAYRLIGECLQAQSDLKGSLQPLLTYTRYELEDAEAWVWLARAQDVAGQREDAFKSLDRALKIDNSQFEALMRRGEIYLEREDGDKALADFRAAQRLQAESFEVGVGIARALMVLKFPGDAYMQLERSSGLAKTDPQKAALYYWRGLSLEELGETLPALRTWNSLLALPKASVPVEWAKYAQERVTELIRLTPTVTATRTVTSTQTRVPTSTTRPSATPRPTQTPVPTETRKP